MNWLDRLIIYKYILNTKIWRVKPFLSLFLWQYLKKFKVKKVGDQYIIHSHLPPINSKAYQRFINEHLVAKCNGPSHAQIGLTNACPMNCDCCYSKNRKGEPLDTNNIIKVISELKELGILWLGLTGGEPLLNKDIVRIVDSIGDNVSSKLFTTGYGLTEDLAADLKKAGLDYVSISLDHWLEEEHDRVRGYDGAFQMALKAIDIFKKKGLHVSVSAVLSRGMINSGQVERFLEYLIELGIDEAWLSEVKPSAQSCWDPELVIREKERLMLVDLQNKYNKDSKITVNYLGYFEGKEHFGCSAGNKMIYIDSFGEVSPCVFTPFTFGNVREKELFALFQEMKSYFPTEESCFINKNYSLFEKYYQGEFPIKREETLKMMDEVSFGSLPRFFQIYTGSDRDDKKGLL